MAASIQLRTQNRDLGMAMREVDDDLAIFLGLKNGEEERNDHLLVNDSDKFDGSLISEETKPDSSLISKVLEVEAAEIVGDDSLLNLEVVNQRSDHDWLTPEKFDTIDSAINQTCSSKDESISIKSELVCSCENRGPSSCRDRKTNSRASTPTRLPSLPAKSKPSRASTPISELSGASLRATSTSSKPVGVQVRSLTPSKASSRSSTLSSRPTISKSGSRSATPTRKPETTHLNLSSASSSDKSSRTALKNSERVKSKLSKPSEIILSLSHDVPQNPKTSMPTRPASISRGRPVTAKRTHSSRSSSNGQPRQKSCSPAKTRASNGATANKIGSVMLSRSRSYNHSGGDDDVNPVLMGTKMVERVVNMRKLAPPKQDDRVSHDSKRKTSIENSGFGRSLSSRSLDMAIRHMEIRRSARDNLRPVPTSILPSSLSGANRSSSSSQSSAVGFTDSRLTSASDSSKSSNFANSNFLYGREMDD